MTSVIRVPLLLLLGAVLLRGFLLGHTDLLDPTETRYASVAQEMVLLHDWLTPRLPMPEGIVPYFGKPPLHFWLTASAYRLFEIDEWTARLPSWLAAVALLVVIWSYGKRFFGEEVGVAAALIAFSSAMFFFLAGASVTDVTLAALVAGSTYSLYLFAISDPSRNGLALLSSGAMALGFLTKGPVAVVLVLLPLVLWSAVRRDFKWLRSIPCLASVGVFVVVAAPWFVAHEVANPGALRYFFWNENIARYLFREYGDKYGSGHVHAYGASWLMLFAAFAPWSLVAVRESYRHGWRRIYDRLRKDEHYLFALLWGISAALFFTFVRQLHAMYVLPCIPGLSLWSAAMLYDRRPEGRPSSCRLEASALTRAPALVAVAIIIVGAWLRFSAMALLLSSALTAGGALALRRLTKSTSCMAAVHSLALASCLVYLTVIVSLTPYLNQHRSAAELLDHVADSTLHNARVPKVGIMSRNGYSLFWTSKAWKGELSREVSVQYTEPESIPKRLRYLILRGQDIPKLPERERARFTCVSERGKWHLFSRKARASLRRPASSRFASFRIRQSGHRSRSSLPGPGIDTLYS